MMLMTQLMDLFINVHILVILMFPPSFLNSFIVTFFWSDRCVFIFLFSLFRQKFIGFLNNLGREKRPVKSLVVGRPILLALEDIDGGPSFLEKALRFLEKYGKVFILVQLFFARTA